MASSTQTVAQKCLQTSTPPRCERASERSERCQLTDAGFPALVQEKKSRSVKDEKEKEFKVREGQDNEKKQNDKTEKQKKETTSQLGS